MKVVLLNYKSGEIFLEELPVPIPREREILIRVRNSLISPGTEGNTISLSKKNMFQKAIQRPDLVKKVLSFAKKSGVSTAYTLVRDKLNSYIPLGYSSSGEVIEIGGEVNEFKVGDRVACCGQGIAYHGEFNVVPINMAVKLPQNLSFREGAFGTLGAIAMQGVRQANASIGENFLVIGMGIVGELTYLILEAGGINVIGCDVDKRKVEFLRDRGFKVFENKYILENYLSLTEGIGFDKVVITASSKGSEPLELGGDVLRKKGILVVVGNVKMEFSRENFYKKEIDLRFSTSYGPGRYDRKYEVEGIDYPLPYVRWTLKRNMESFLKLISDKKIKVNHLISHTFSIDDYKKAYEIILDKKEIFSGVLFKYGEEKEVKRSIKINEFSGISDDKISIGVIGAGNFPKSFILPLLKKRHDVEFFGVSVKNGYSIKELKEKFPFKYGFTDYKEMVEKDFDALFIFTRHDLHLKLLIEGLKRGKFVYVEKPLAICEEEFLEFKKELEENYEKWKFMVGFNRRFSPYGKGIKDFFSDRKTHLTFYYRVNCGFLPEDSWIYSKEGGGRILSEVCHFLDFMVFVSGEKIKSVFGKEISGVDGKYRDNFLIEIDFESGSKGVILYTNLTDEGLMKEYIEIHTHRKMAVVEDFKRLSLYGGDKKSISGAQKKGYFEEIDRFIEWIKNGGSPPIPYDEILNVTSGTFGILKSLKEGREIEID